MNGNPIATRRVALRRKRAGTRFIHSITHRPRCRQLPSGPLRQVKLRESPRQSPGITYWSFILCAHFDCRNLQLASENEKPKPARNAARRAGKAGNVHAPLFSLLRLSGVRNSTTISLARGAAGKPCPLWPRSARLRRGEPLPVPATQSILRSRVQDETSNAIRIAYLRNRSTKFLDRRRYFLDPWRKFFTP